MIKKKHKKKLAALGQQQARKRGVLNMFLYHIKSKKENKRIQRNKEIKAEVNNNFALIDFSVCVRRFNRNLDRINKHCDNAIQGGAQ